MADDVAYQQSAQVEQLQAERENAVTYGQKTRVEAIDKQLKELGVKKAAEKRAESKDDDKKAEPEGRQTKQDKQHDAG